MAELPRRHLGSTGLEVSVIGLGGAGLSLGGLSDDVSCDVVAAFLREGVNFIDVGPSYGDAERKLGLALVDAPRGSIVLQSKCGDEGPQNSSASPFSRSGVLSSVRHSLATLRVPYLDSLLLHDPYAEELDAFLAPGGGLEAVRELRGAGLVRHFGCGCREHEPHVRLSQALSPGEFQVCQTVDDHNLMRRFLGQGGLRETILGTGAGLVNAAPLYRGLLTNEPLIYGGMRGSGGRSLTGEHPELVALSQSMREWAEGRGLSLLNMAVQFPMLDEDIACSLYSCMSVAHVQGVAEAARTPLPSSTWAAFEAAFAGPIAELEPEKHFYWFKKQTADSREWAEMAVYPRAMWGESIYTGGPSMPKRARY